MKKVKILFFIVLSGILVLAIDVKINLFSPLPITQAVQYELLPGTPLRALASQLQERDVIRRPFYLIAYARLDPIGKSLQAGEYSIDPGMSAYDILKKMQRGQVVLHNFTVIEGWTFQQLLEALQNNPLLHRTIENTADTGSVVMQALGKPETHPEGQFLPDTYSFVKGSTDIEFLRRAHSALQAHLQTEWENRADNLPLQTPYAALILASIIEKETGKPEERPLIAAVFINRLKKRMRLQTDPTVIYGIGENFDGNIRFDDLRTDTPYNTYTRSGLPPTPIALPGAEAIHAALNPVASDALYFVSKNDGSHIFSNSLTEHEAAVDQYQRRRRER